MKLERPRRSERVMKSLKMLPETIRQIEDLATAYDTTQARIVEALFRTHYPRLIRDAERALRK